MTDIEVEAMKNVISLHRKHLKQEISTYNRILSDDRLGLDSIEKRIINAKLKDISIALDNLESLMMLEGVVIGNE